MAQPVHRQTEPALVIYDGECPFCRNFARLIRLREAVGPVELLDARSGDPRVTAYQRQGYNLNLGMLFVWRGEVYYAGDAVHVLGRLSSPVSWFNRLNAILFANRTVSRWLYPLLNLCRVTALALRGRGLIKPPPAVP